VLNPYAVVLNPYASSRAHAGALKSTTHSSPPPPPTHTHTNTLITSSQEHIFPSHIHVETNSDPPPNRPPLSLLLSSCHVYAHHPPSNPPPPSLSIDSPPPLLALCPLPRTDKRAVVEGKKTNLKGQHTMTLGSKYARAMTFENLWQQMRA
jgi:hypothetical protein